MIAPIADVVCRWLGHDWQTWLVRREGSHRLAETQRYTACARCGLEP